MNLYLIIKTLHIISSAILFGTGIGIAFFMFRSMFIDNIHQRLYAARNTILADWMFTLPAGVVQPITGFWLMNKAGYNPADTWLMVTFALYCLAGVCWLPVVWIQLQLKQMLEISAINHSPIPERFNRLFKWWFVLGWPAFSALIAIFYLMVAKPT